MKPRRRLEQKNEAVKKSGTEQKSDVGQKPNTEQKSDNNINTQTNGNGKEHIAWDSDTCTITGTVEGIGTKNEGTGESTDENTEPTVPEEPVEEVDEDCVVGHRYCVCGASFEFRKNSGLDKDAWNAHVQEHAAKGEMVRWTDK